MLTVKLHCQTCGHEFEFSPQDYSIKGLQFIPKHCPACLDRRAGIKKVVLKRRCLKSWEGVFIEDINKLTDEFVEEKGLYKLYFFGGPQTGPAGGYTFSHRWLVYVDKALPFPSVVNIRLMEKEFETKEVKKISKYVVIEPNFSNDKRFYIYLLTEFHSHSLGRAHQGGYGKEFLIPEDLSGPGQIIQEEVISTSSGSYWGLHGNIRRWIVTNRSSKILYLEREHYQGRDDE